MGRRGFAEKLMRTRHEYMLDVLPARVEIAERHKKQQYDTTDGGKTSKKKANHLLRLSRTAITPE